MTEEPKKSTAPLVMDVMHPSTTESVKPDHQLTEHGTPDAPGSVDHEQTAEALLDQVAVEHATVSSRPKLPIGLIVVTLTVVVILAVLSWFALNVDA